MSQDDLYKALLSNGPWAMAAAYLGRYILSCWKEDRDQLRSTSQQTLVLLQKLNDRLDVFYKEKA